MVRCVKCWQKTRPLPPSGRCRADGGPRSMALERCRGYQSRQNTKTTSPLAFTAWPRTAIPDLANCRGPVRGRLARPQRLLTFSCCRARLPIQSQLFPHESHDVASELHRSRAHFLASRRKSPDRKGFPGPADSHSNRTVSTGFAPASHLRRRALSRTTTPADAGTRVRRLGLYVTAQTTAARSGRHAPALDTSSAPGRRADDQRNRSR